MTTVANGGPTPDPTPEKGKAASAGEQSVKAGGAAAVGADAGAKKASAAELKAKKQAEKAARRAHVIATKAAAAAAPESSSPATQPQGSAEGSKGGAKTKPKQDGGPPAAAARGGKQSTATPAVPEKEKEVKSSVPEFLGHIPAAKRLPLDQADRDVHPVVLALGQQMATFTLRENIARLEGTLRAFKEVLRSYEAPAGNAFSRHFVPHVLNPQIEYLTECRPMCYAMGNAIRLLKTRVSDLDLDTTDKQAIRTLCRAIDAFIQEKICYAEVIITRNAAAMICAGDVVLTYGHHRLVRKAALEAWRGGKRFEVVVVDDQDGSLGGARLAKALKAEGVRTTYFPELAEMCSALRRPGTKVMLGVEAVFANGALYAPSGTSDVAAAASALEVPVVALCESINVDRDRVAVDSLTYNELDPEMAVEGGARLLFDTTRAEHVSVLVTEYEDVTGNSPAAAVMSILRKQDDPN